MSVAPTPRTDAAILTISEYIGPQAVWREMTSPQIKVNARYVSVDFARQLERDLAAATAQLQTAQRDAERYRWIRRQSDACLDVIDAPHESTQEFDAAIDAAIAEAKEPKT